MWWVKEKGEPTREIAEQAGNGGITLLECRAIPEILHPTIVPESFLMQGCLGTLKQLQMSPDIIQCPPEPKSPLVEKH